MYGIHITECETFYRVTSHSKHSKHITYLCYNSHRVNVRLETNLHLIFLVKEHEIYFFYAYFQFPESHQASLA